ncbi:MAG: protease modulator HflC [Burkholderiaceae bacterium]
MSKSWRIGLIVAAFVLAWLLSGTLYIVGEGQQALVVRQGAPIGVITRPGLEWNLPLIDSVTYYDARLLMLEPPPEQVILGDQKRIVVQAYARYRIANPLRFNQSVRTLDLAAPQIGQIVSSSLRRVLGQVMLPALLSAQRAKIVDAIQSEVTDKAKGLGIEVAEVRLHRADLPPETSQAIYDRMKSERQREAKELRAQGFEWAQQIQATADRERTVILSEAQRQSKINRGEADAAANSILGKAFGKDATFYHLYRSLQTYRQALADSGGTLVLSPDTAFLGALKAGPASVLRH